jgi:hypothetical protein
MEMASGSGKSSGSEPLRRYEEGGKPVSTPSPNDAIVAKHGGDISEGIVTGQIRPDLICRGRGKVGSEIDPSVYTEST